MRHALSFSKAAILAVNRAVLSPCVFPKRLAHSGTIHLPLDDLPALMRSLGHSFVWKTPSDSKGYDSPDSDHSLASDNSIDSLDSDSKGSDYSLDTDLSRNSPSSPSPSNPSSKTRKPQRSHEIVAARNFPVPLNTSEWINSPLDIRNNLIIHHQFSDNFREVFGSDLVPLSSMPFFCFLLLYFILTCSAEEMQQACYDCDATTAAEYLDKFSKMSPSLNSLLYPISQCAR